MRRRSSRYVASLLLDDRPLAELPRMGGIEASVIWKKPFLLLTIHPYVRNMKHALFLISLLAATGSAQDQSDSARPGTGDAQGTFSPVECFRVLPGPEAGSAFVRIIRLDTDWTVVDREPLLNYLADRLRGILDCYERELRKSPSLAGEVELEIAAHSSGRVTAANTTANTTNDLVARCVANRARQWIFPSPKSGFLLFLRFEFVVKSEVMEE